MVNGLYGWRNAGWRGPSGRLAGLGALQLSMNKSAYAVGEAPTYTIQGGAPNTEILWSSTRAGASTGENMTDYGQKTDANGVLTGSGGPWTSNDVGSWTKTANVGSESATSAFQVQPLPTPAVLPPGYVYPVGTVTAPLPAAAADTIDLFGTKVSKPLFYGGVALLAVLLLRKK